MAFEELKKEINKEVWPIRDIIEYEQGTITTIMNDRLLAPDKTDYVGSFPDAKIDAFCDLIAARWQLNEYIDHAMDKDAIKAVLIQHFKDKYAEYVASQTPPE